MIVGSEDKIKVRWISKRYGNFTYNKIYIAEARAVQVGSGLYTDYRITDDEGDLYSLTEKDRGKKFFILDGGVLC